MDRTQSIDAILNMQALEGRGLRTLPDGSPACHACLNPVPGPVLVPVRVYDGEEMYFTVCYDHAQAANVGKRALYVARVADCASCGREGTFCTGHKIPLCAHCVDSTLVEITVPV